MEDKQVVKHLRELFDEYEKKCDGICRECKLSKEIQFVCERKYSVDFEFEGRLCDLLKGMQKIMGI